MATKNFTQFSLNTELSSNDYLIGYYGNGLEEFKLTIDDLKKYLEPTITVITSTEFSLTNSTTLTPVNELNITIPANSKYAITGQILLKEIGNIAPGIDSQVVATPSSNVFLYGNHNRYDLIDLSVGVIVPTDTNVGTRERIIQLDAADYSFFSVPVSFVVDNTNNQSCVIEHRLGQTTQTSSSTFIVGIGSYLIGHPINNN
jgi:hypothetical protein